MRVEEISVVGVLDQLQSGRNKPYLVECEYNEDSIECVAKVWASECRTGGLFRELYASLLAQHLGVPVPKPYIVRVGYDLATFLPQNPMYEPILQSVGLNFGCENLKGGYTTWASDRALTDRTAPDAMKIFMFDALTRNPDRRLQKPNVLTRSGQIVAIDHEMCFGFLHDFRPEPLVVKNELKDHLFFDQLKSWRDDADVLAGDEWGEGLAGLDESVVGEIAANIPSIWLDTEPEINDHMERISQHLGRAKMCANEFVLQVKEALS